jgi:hypothetical protein
VSTFLFQDRDQLSRQESGGREPLSQKAEHKLIIWSWIAVSLFGVFQALASRFYMNPDGVSYADLADAWRRGDWHNAINACWSPLYPFLLSIIFRLFHPSPYFESTAIHLFNFFLYLICFALLQFLIRELAAVQALRAEIAADERFSRPMLLLIGTGVFLLATQSYLPLSLVTPDLCVVAMVFLANAVILRMEKLGATFNHLSVLGVILAFGYLAKAAFFLLAFVFMAMLLARRNEYRKTLIRMAVVLLAFFVVAGPNILAVSAIKHRLTFADTGRLNYLWFVNGTSQTHLQVHGNAQGEPVHTTRTIFEHPNVYEFAEPIGGTYPVWFDPSYWHDGLRPKFNWQQQLRAIEWNWYAFKAIILSTNYICFSALLLLLLQWKSRLFFRENVASVWRIVVPSLAAIGLYLLVYVQARYLAGFLMVIWIAIFSSVRAPRTGASQRIFSAVTITLTLAISVTLYPQFRSNIEAAFQPMRNTDWEVAKALRDDFGLHDGDSIGCAGNCFFSYWARLGKLNVMTEIPSREALVFRGSSSSTQAAALQAISVTGAKAVVSTIDLGKGWNRVAQTDYYVYDLRREKKSAALVP